MAGEFYEFDGTGTLEPVLSGVLLPHNLASPTGLTPYSTAGSAWPSSIVGRVGRAA